MLSSGRRFLVLLFLYEDRQRRSLLLANTVSSAFNQIFQNVAHLSPHGFCQNIDRVGFFLSRPTLVVCRILESWVPMSDKLKQVVSIQADIGVGQSESSNCGV